MSDEDPIYVTRPFLPPLCEVMPSLEAIWHSRQLTNGGTFHQEFESRLAEYLGVPFVSLFTNATIALVTALQCLRVTGEVITTPYSFVATGHALLWNGIDPVFVDVDPVSLALDPLLVEAAITPRTTAILPVHVYGRPAATKELQAIADTYGLKLIYDAAHTFGSSSYGESVASAGDLAVLSFHATKVMNTFEGGAIVSHDPKVKQRIDYLKNFGFADETTVVAPGINGKMSEFQAAIGLSQLPYIDECINARREVAENYDRAFSGVAGINLLPPIEGWRSNFSYYPLFVDPEFQESRDSLYQRLRDHGIFARRYFYPLISDFPMYRGRSSAARSNLPVAAGLADSVLCLPIFPELAGSDQKRIISVALED